MSYVIAVHPWPPHQKVKDQLEEIRDALGSDLTFSEAKPGSPDPILAIRQPPDFICDAVVVHEPQQLEAAVRVCAGLGLEYVSTRELLSDMLGAEVKKETISRGKIGRVH